MKKSNINFTIKNRLYDLIAKSLSLKMVWTVLITIIFLVTAKLPAIIYVGFVAAALGLNSIDKAIYGYSNKKEIMGSEPDV